MQTFTAMFLKLERNWRNLEETHSAQDQTRVCEVSMLLVLPASSSYCTVAHRIKIQSQNRKSTLAFSELVDFKICVELVCS